MFGSAVLDVAVGLSLLFLFVSLICAAIREAIETVVCARAADLERGIRDLLGDPDGTGAAQALYGHPLIAVLCEGPYVPGQLRAQRSLLTGTRCLAMPIRARGRLPAYIPSGNFAAALLDIVVRGPREDSQGGALSIESLSARATAMPDGRIRRTLLVALDQAGGEIDRVRWLVERWFDSCMDRISGRYKRRTQAMLFVIGLVVAGAMNIDAFSVGQALFEDKALRDGAVAQAATLVPHDLEQPIPQQAEQGFAVLSGELAQIRFPCGWGDPPPQRLNGLGAVMQMLVGWLVTAFAVMLGAPFWFDMLNRFMIARSTIKPALLTRTA